MEKDSIRNILASCGKLKVEIDQLDDDSDLYEAGLTSLSTVNVMLAIEDQFDIEFTDDSLNKETFKTVNSLTGVVSQLRTAAA